MNPGLGPSQVDFSPARKGLFFSSGKLLIRQGAKVDDLPLRLPILGNNILA
jgi:hypothetical protein